MELKITKCPNCGAPLNISESKINIKCLYCGSEIIVDDGNQVLKDANQVSKVNIDIEKLRRNTSLARGVIENFRRMQEHLFDEISIVVPPMIFTVDALKDGLTGIKEKIVQVKDSLAWDVPEVELLQSLVNDLEPVLEITSSEDDFIDGMDFADWECLQKKILIILEQGDKVIDIICRRYITR